MVNQWALKSFYRDKISEFLSKTKFISEMRILVQILNDAGPKKREIYDIIFQHQNES